MKTYLIIAIMTAALATAAQAGSYQGKFQWGGGASDFIPCGSNSASWVVLSDAQTKTLRAAYQAKKLSVKDMVYIVFEGSSTAKPEGVADGYEDAVALTTLTTVEKLTTQCDPAR